MSLDQIVSVTIQAGTTQPSRRGFGTPLLLAHHTENADLVRTYSSPAGLLADGFTVNDPAYKMAAAVFSQSPRPPQIKLGRLDTVAASPHTVEIDVTGIISGQSVKMTVTSPDGTQTDISVPFDTDEPTTAGNLATALSAISGLSASASVNVATADADVDGEMFFYSALENADIKDVTGDWAYDTRLGEILNIDSDFYTVCIDVNSEINIEDVAAWANTNKRLAVFAPQYSSPTEYNTDVATALKSGDNDRAVSLLRAGSRAEFADCAWVGEALPFDPGSQTWSLKSLSGVTTDPWTASEITAIELENSNHYTSVAGVSITRNGLTHGGEFIDVVRGLDWLEARLQERIFAVLANARKVPFTDSGVQMIVNEIEGQLLDAEARGVLSPGESTVTFTPVADISTADRAARCLTGIEFQARLAGAVHKVTIVGTVSV